MKAVRPREAGAPHDATVRLIGECGGVERVAAFTDRRASSIYRYTDPDQSDGMPFAMVAQLTEHFGALAAAEHLAARAGGVFVPVPVAEASPQWGQLTAETAQHFADVMRDIAQALAPDGDGGHAVTPAEASAMVADLDHAIHDLCALRSLAMGTARGDGG